jgi:hypothetical protein
MICQIFKVNLPTCLTAIRRKTTTRTITAIYVDECQPYRKMSIRIHPYRVSLNGENKDLSNIFPVCTTRDRPRFFGYSLKTASGNAGIRVFQIDPPGSFNSGIKE